MYRSLALVAITAMAICGQNYHKTFDSLVAAGVSGFCLFPHMYSGLPDPYFFVTDHNKVVILREKLKKYHPAKPFFLEKEIESVQFRPRSGYTAMEIRSFGDTTGIPDFIQIFNGTVAVTDNHTWIDLYKVATRKFPVPHAKFFPDPNSDLERTFICLGFLNDTIAPMVPEHLSTCTKK